MTVRCHHAAAAILLLAFAAALPAQSQQQPAATTAAPTPAAAPQFRRMSLIVSNLDETLALFRDVLGFTIEDVRPDPPDSYVFEAFNIDRSVTPRHATIGTAEQPRVLSVVEVPGRLLDAPQSPRLAAALINANGRLDAIVAELKRRDYRVLNPHRLGKSGTEIGFLDRDGHLIVLYQMTPSELGKSLP